MKFQMSLQRDNLREEENDQTAAKSGISPPPFGFSLCTPFPNTLLLIAGFCFLL